MEKAIRDQITSEGFYGRSAKFHSVRLIAIQRPGWVQVYRFEATARPADDLKSEHQWLLGLVHDDGRSGTKVRIFQNAGKRRALFAEWSEGLICLRGSESLAG